MDLGTGKVQKPTTLKKVTDPVTGREVKPKTLLHNMQKSPENYLDFYSGQRQGGMNWWQGQTAQRFNEPFRLGNSNPLNNPLPERPLGLPTTKSDEITNLSELYRSAFERGDIQEGQRLLDLWWEKRTGQEPFNLYHGSHKENIKLDPQYYEKLGLGSGMDNIFFTTPDPTIAKYYGPFTHRLYVKSTNPNITNYKGASWDGLNLPWSNQQALNDLNSGYDMSILKNIKEPPGITDDYVSLNLKNIKSAEPFTLDNNSNLIPLNERFNFGVNDIRYMDIPSNQERSQLINNAQNHEFDNRLTFGEDQIKARADRLSVPFDKFKEDLWKKTFFSKNDVLKYIRDNKGNVLDYARANNADGPYFAPKTMISVEPYIYNGLDNEYTERVIKEGYNVMDNQKIVQLHEDLHRRMSNDGVKGFGESSEYIKECLKEIGDNIHLQDIFSDIKDAKLYNYLFKDGATDLIARIGQLKDALGLKKGEELTVKHLRYLKDNYSKYFYDNQVLILLNHIKDDKLFCKFANTKGVKKYVGMIISPIVYGLSNKYEQNVEK